MNVFKYIPHSHVWKETRINGLTYMPSEKKCILCGKYIHLPWKNFLKSNAWVEGRFE